VHIVFGDNRADRIVSDVCVSVCKDTDLKARQRNGMMMEFQSQRGLCTSGLLGWPRGVQSPWRAVGRWQSRTLSIRRRNGVLGCWAVAQKTTEFENGVPYVDEADEQPGVGRGKSKLGRNKSVKGHITPHARVRSGFIKPDSELKGLLHKMYEVSDDSDGGNYCERLTAAVRGVPVYVMLPLDTVWLVPEDEEGLESEVEYERSVAPSTDNGNGPTTSRIDNVSWYGGQRKKSTTVLMREKGIEVGLEMLRASGVEGVMVDVWWGIVEHDGPKQYDFSAYRCLFEQVASKGLKIQAVMSFHAAGGNVGDTCTIPLPPWVYEAGEEDPDIFYTDAEGYRNPEYLSLGCDVEPCLFGRTPVQAYTDFITAFADEFDYLLGDTISEITVGLGPAGELRYPSYPEGDGRWRFPGVGQFQCFDKYMLRKLELAAEDKGRPEWGHGGPHDAGHYNSREWETGFFKNEGGSFESDYGKFFLNWYSTELIQHADRVLSAANEVISDPGRPRAVKAVQESSDGGSLFVFEPAAKLSIKLAGVHWWFKSRAHAAELTAGYYNTRDRDGYASVFDMLKKHKTSVSFTCVEMRDCEHPGEGMCSPEGLLHQVLASAGRAGISVSGENALQRYDDYAFDKIAESAFGQSAMAGRMDRLTFLRMGDMMVDNWDAFAAFIKRLTCPPDHWVNGNRP